MKAQGPNYWTAEEFLNLLVFKGHLERALGHASQQLLGFSEWALGVSSGLGPGGLGSQLGRITDSCVGLPSHPVSGLVFLTGNT